MKTWKMGFVFWVALLLAGWIGMPANAEESAKSIHLPAAYTLGVLPAWNAEPDTAHSVWTKPETASWMGGAGEDSISIPGVSRSRFEQLRRQLPYGSDHDPITRYLEDD